MTVTSTPRSRCRSKILRTLLGESLGITAASCKTARSRRRTATGDGSNVHTYLSDESDLFAPRMHYYDDTANSAQVYVGYFGRHLKNTKH